MTKIGLKVSVFSIILLLAGGFVYSKIDWNINRDKFIILEADSGLPFTISWSVISTQRGVIAHAVDSPQTRPFHEEFIVQDGESVTALLHAETDFSKFLIHRDVLLCDIHTSPPSKFKAHDFIGGSRTTVLRPIFCKLTVTFG